MYIRASTQGLPGIKGSSLANLWPSGLGGGEVPHPGRSASGSSLQIPPYQALDRLQSPLHAEEGTTPAAPKLRAHSPFPPGPAEL